MCNDTCTPHAMTNSRQLAADVCEPKMTNIVVEKSSCDLDHLYIWLDGNLNPISVFYWLFIFSEKHLKLYIIFIGECLFEILGNQVTDTPFFPPSPSGSFTPFLLFSFALFLAFSVLIQNHSAGCFSKLAQHVSSVHFFLSL